MNTVNVGQLWKHFKGFELKISALAKHTETMEELVVYEHNGEIWARPLSMFTNPDDVGDRKDNVTGQKYRFEKVSES